MSAEKLDRKMKLSILWSIILLTICGLGRALPTDELSVRVQKGRQEIWVSDKLIYKAEHGTRILSMAPNVSANNHRIVLLAGSVSVQSSRASESFGKPFIIVLARSREGDMWVPSFPNCEGIEIIEIAGIYDESNKSKLSIMAMITDTKMSPGDPLYKWVKVKWADILKPSQIEPVVLKH